MSVKERLKEYISFKKISEREFCRTINVAGTYVNSIRVSIQPDKLHRISLHFSDLNTSWLLTGEGEMLKKEYDPNELKGYFVNHIPVSAQGGSLNDFVVSLKDSDCEKIISPIKGADWSLTVSGDSMYPEYPSGSKILIKKINEKSFIEWGRCYVLDTCNGVVVKKIAAPEEEDVEFGLDYVTCVSINKDPIYKSFRVPMNDVYGIYRVLLLLAEK